MAYGMPAKTPGSSFHRGLITRRGIGAESVRVGQEPRLIETRAAIALRAHPAFQLRMHLFGAGRVLCCAREVLLLMRVGCEVIQLFRWTRVIALHDRRDVLIRPGSIFPRGPEAPLPKAPGQVDVRRECIFRMKVPNILPSFCAQAAHGINIPPPISAVSGMDLIAMRVGSAAQHRYKGAPINVRRRFASSDLEERR